MNVSDVKCLENIDLKIDFAFFFISRLKKMSIRTSIVRIYYKKSIGKKFYFYVKKKIINILKDVKVRVNWSFYRLDILPPHVTF